MPDEKGFIALLGYSLAGMLGVVAANYAAVPLNNMYYELIAGIIIFAAPVYLLKGSGLGESMAKLFMGVLGLSLVARALINMTALQIPANAQNIF